MVVRALAADRRWLLGCGGGCESMLLRMWERGAAIVVVGGGVERVWWLGEKEGGGRWDGWEVG